MGSVSQCTAFVAGATGFTGREIVRVLAEHGCTVVAHVRPDSDRLSHWREQFEGQGARVDTTAWDAGAMTQTFEDLQPTHVFSVLGTTRKRAATEGLRTVADAYERIDYGLTALLLDAAVASGAPLRFIYLSSLGVSDTSRNPYFRARGRVEKRLRESTLDYVVVRPSLIVGPERDDPRPMERLSATVVDTMVAVAGAFGARRLRDRYRSITPADLAAGMVRVALDPERCNVVVNAEDLRGRD